MSLFRESKNSSIVSLTSLLLAMEDLVLQRLAVEKMVVKVVSAEWTSVELVVWAMIGE